MAWMVIRVRGTIHARHDLKQTLDGLHLTRANHATILPETPGVRGMLGKVQGYVTWGEAEAETVGLLLGARGVAADGGKLTPEASGTDAAELVARDGMLHLGIRPLFRLKPPKGGWKSTKKPFALGGALGYRGRAINELARRMV